MKLKPHWRLLRDSDGKLTLERQVDIKFSRVWNAFTVTYSRSAILRAIERFGARAEV